MAQEVFRLVSRVPSERVFSTADEVCFSVEECFCFLDEGTIYCREATSLPDPSIEPQEETYTVVDLQH